MLSQPVLECWVYWDIWALFFDWHCFLPAFQPTMNISVVWLCLFFLLFHLFPVLSLSSFLQIKVPLSAGSFNFTLTVAEGLNHIFLGLFWGKGKILGGVPPACLLKGCRGQKQEHVLKDLKKNTVYLLSRGEGQLRNGLWNSVVMISYILGVFSFLRKPAFVLFW